MKEILADTGEIKIHLVAVDSLMCSDVPLASESFISVQTTGLVITDILQFLSYTNYILQINMNIVWFSSEGFVIQFGTVGKQTMG